METVKAACNAMATRFEMVLHGRNRVALRAAAEEAIREIERLHAQLSLYLPSSELADINRRAAHQAVQVEPQLFSLLQQARRIHEETLGAFDITVAPLLRCWGFMGASGALPTEEQIAEARAQVGMEHVLLDDRRSTIRFARPGMMIDLGSIGKGYALEVAMETLVEAGVADALVHGGTSTACAMGAPLEAPAWRIAIEPPPADLSKDRVPEPLAVVELHNESLSVSAVHGKCFQANGKVYGHVIDPRTGAAVPGAILAAIVLPSATETDAFSTALLVEGWKGREQVAKRRPGMRALVVEPSASAPPWRVSSQGIRLGAHWEARAD